MEAGYVLDYVYYVEPAGGEPHIYVRKEGSPRYRTVSEYHRAVGDDLFLPKFLEQSRYSFLDHVQTDGTAAGFFQLVLLRIMGGQFYLFWHAAYDDRTVICSRAGLEAALAEAEEFVQVPREVRAKAEQLDLEPKVEFTDETVTVRVIMFTKWGGFIEEKYTFSRSFPHKLLKQGSETLVPYDSGIIF